MSEGSVGRALFKISAFTTAVVLTFGSASVAAFAQDAPTSTSPVPAEISTPSSAPSPSNQPPPPAPPKVVPASPSSIVDGVVFADKNRNGRQEQGEAIAGGAVTLSGNGSEHRTTTNADGRFAFRDLAPGTYRPSYALAGGWVVHQTKDTGDLITVTANQATDVVARAERPYSEQLTATATLDRTAYRQPATARITLTLTNTTDRPISGVQAVCDRDGTAGSFGRGQAWHVLKGAGIKLGAGEKRTFTIYDPIPLAARGTGKAVLRCDFAPNAGWNVDGPSVRAEATVTGAASGYTMVLGDDRNGDGVIDAAEAIAVDGFHLLNQQTGEKIERRDEWFGAGSDGKIEFVDVPIGDYKLVLHGSWTFRYAGQDDVRITPEGGFSYGYLAPLSPAAMRGTVKFDKPYYGSHETVRVELTVTNVGGKAAQNVRLHSDLDALSIPAEQWGEFGPGGGGVRLAAGESRTFTVTGTIRSFSNGKLTLWGGFDFTTEEGWKSGFREFDGTVDVVQTVGDMAGVVYIDKNRNGQQDAGEAAGATAVEITGGAPLAHFTAVTDVDGRFWFSNIPSGGYWISYTLAGGWTVHLEGAAQQTRVQPGAVTQLVARADRPYRERLKARVVLDKATYTMGDEAQITITLTNTDNQRISGIKAGCNRSNRGDHLGGSYYRPMSSSWGELRSTGAGVALEPGETKTFVVAEQLPPAVGSSRKVFVACDFAPNPEHNNDGPYGYDWASITGGLVTLTGWVAEDRNRSRWFDEGEGIPNARIRLVTDRENGFLVAEAVSDAKGNVRLDRVPPGEFWVKVDGPWKFEGDGDHVVVQNNNLNHPWFFDVVPDPSHRAKPDAPDPDPAPGTYIDSGTHGALAKTGASVLGLGVVAVLLVAFGLAARVAGRRKTY